MLEIPTRKLHFFSCVQAKRNELMHQFVSVLAWVWKTPVPRCLHLLDQINLF